MDFHGFFWTRGHPGLFGVTIGVNHFRNGGLPHMPLTAPLRNAKPREKINQIILQSWTVFTDCSQRNESMAAQIQLSQKGKADFSGTIPDRITGKKHGNAPRQPERTLSTTSTLPKSGNLKKRPVKTALRPLPLNGTSRTGTNGVKIRPRASCIE